MAIWHKDAGDRPVMQPAVVLRDEIAQIAWHNRVVVRLNALHHFVKRVKDTVA